MVEFVFFVTTFFFLPDAPDRPLDSRTQQVKTLEICLANVKKINKLQLPNGIITRAKCEIIEADGDPA